MKKIKTRRPRGSAANHDDCNTVVDASLSVKPGELIEQPDTGGWFKAKRFTGMPDLVKKHRSAFMVAYMLAYRARWNPDALNPYDLEIGEAVCDYENWGYTRQEFRTGKEALEELGFATFRTTSKSTSNGTVGRLVNTELFSVFALLDNQQPNHVLRAIRAKETLTDSGTGVFSQARKHPLCKKADKPRSLQEIFDYAANREGEDLSEGDLWDLVDRFAYFNNSKGWHIKGEPIRNWKRAFDRFDEDCNTGNGVNSVPADWEPCIE